MPAGDGTSPRVTQATIGRVNNSESGSHTDRATSLVPSFARMPIRVKNPLSDAGS